MKWLAALALVSGTAAAVWPTPVPRPTATPRPVATPTPRPAATATATPRPVATAVPTPETSVPVVREFVILTGASITKPAVGAPIRFSSGGEFVVLVRFGDELVPCQLVRVAR